MYWTDVVGGGVIQWNLDYNAWDVLLGQVHVLLNQVSYGAGLDSVPSIFYTLFCSFTKMHLLDYIGKVSV